MLDVAPTDSDGTPVPEALLKAMQQDRAWWTIFCFIIVTALSFLFSILIKEDLRRLKYGKREPQEIAKAASAGSEDGYKRLDEKPEL